MSDPVQDAKQRAADIIRRQVELIGQARLPDGTPIDMSRVIPERAAEAFFATGSGSHERVRGLHQNIAELLNPQGNHQAALEWLTAPGQGGAGGGGMPPEMAYAIIDAGRKNYAGPGWSKSEREQHKQQTGSYPTDWQLAPGDFQTYQRRLDSHFLQSVQQAAQQQHKKYQSPNYVESPKAADIGLLADSGRVFDDESEYQRALANANSTYDAARGERSASGLMGSAYPWHQGGAAVGDAMATTDSPIARYFSKNRVLSDVAAYMGMTSDSPLTSASTTAESRDHFNRVSPVVPDGTPEERAKYLASIKNALNAADAPDYSDSYYETYGKPPSYLAQGTMNVLNNLVDASPLAVATAPKIVSKAATALARTSLPVASAYGAHIANKTMSGALTPFGRMVLGETKEDVPYTAGIMGLSTSLDPEKPPVSKWMSPGIQNRRDMMATFYSPGFSESQKVPMHQMSQEETNDYFKQQDTDRAAALKHLEQANTQHPNSYLSRQDLPSAAARAVGEGANEAWQGITSGAQTQMKANRTAPVQAPPFLFMR